MSGEQIINREANKSLNDNTMKSKQPRVNINHLLSKIREEKNKQKKENYMFVGIVVGALAVSGIIASL
tara:strand:+ start:1648 stop:1851 length:204 start_codon:yes stop_codon:yes gene_type:complete